ncbi:14808_t:CDS:2, partial [Cetraspora pellucida]
MAFNKTRTTLDEAKLEKTVDFYEKSKFKFTKSSGTVQKANFHELNITVALISLRNYPNLDGTFVEKLQKLKKLRGSPHIINFYGIAKGANNFINSTNILVHNHAMMISGIGLSSSGKKRDDIYRFGEILSKIFKNSLQPNLLNERNLLGECIELCNKCMDKNNPNQPTIKKVYEDLMQLEDGGFIIEKIFQ